MRFYHLQWTFSDTADIVIASALAVIVVVALFS
jgi:hypothetical protein